jgi:hypothetical protein
VLDAETTGLLGQAGAEPIAKTKWVVVNPTDGKQDSAGGLTAA